MHDKIITALLAVLIALGGWTLSRTFSLSQDMVLLKKKYRGLKMKYRTLKLLRKRKNARKRNQTTEKGVQALIIGLALVLFLLVGCENIKHKIGISTKPFQSGEDLEDSTKINYTIVFGKVRPQEDD